MTNGVHSVTADVGVLVSSDASGDCHKKHMLSTKYHVGCCEWEELHSREVSDGGLCCISHTMQKCGMLSSEQLAHMPVRQCTSACTSPRTGVHFLHHKQMLDNAVCGRRPNVSESSYRLTAHHYSDYAHSAHLSGVVLPM